MPEATLPTQCPTPRKGHFQGSGDNWTVIDYVPCNRWQCLYCGPKKQWKFQLRLKTAKYNKFVTLTHRPAPGETQETALRAMRKDWHTLHKVLDRIDKRKKITYVCIVEWTKAGQPHLHILMDGPYIAQRKLSGAWKRIHNSPIVDIRRVKSDESACLYLTKYLTKDVRCPARMRRWSSTRGFLPPLPPYVNPNWPEETAWGYQKVSPIAFALHAQESGATLLEGPGTSLIIIWQTEPRETQPATRPVQTERSGYSP